MAKKALAILLALLTLPLSPAFEGYRLFAQTVVTTQFDPATGTMKPLVMAAPSVERAVGLIEQNRAILDRVPKENVAQVVELLRRYGPALQAEGARPEATKALDTLLKDLGEGRKDPNLAIAAFYDKFSEFARDSDSAATTVDILSTTRDEHGNRKQVVAVGSRAAGKTLFVQEATEIGPNSFRKVIRRPDPKNPAEEVVDVVIIETEKGAAKEQRVVYNRRIHLLLRNMKKMFYDQCSLVRKINNGSAGLDNGSCSSPEGHYDKNINDKAKRTMRAAYDKKRDAFPPKLLAYLERLDKLAKKDHGAGLVELDWKELEEIQRAALGFYNDSQVETMQKIVILQITSYFSQVTNTQAKQEKDGSEAVDALSKPTEDLQKALTKFENGDLQGYGLMIKAIGGTQLSHEDEKYITPELMAIAAEAFADVAYAVKAQKRALQPGMTGEEQDAAIEESQSWLKLAQIQLQSFELQTLAIQLERLKKGELRDHLGLDDPEMKKEAQRLADSARAEYLPKLAEANRESKDNLLRLALGTFNLTLQNAMMAYLYSDTLQERLRTLAAKAGEMKALYLAREFEKVRDNAEYKGNTALFKLQGGAYGYFLDHLPASVKKNAEDLDKFSQTLNALAKVKAVPDIRAGLKPVEAEFTRLAKAMGFDTIPDAGAVRKQSQALGIKHGKVFAATQNFSSNVRIFDLMNELDLYCRKYASPEMVDSESEGMWSKFISFKWLDSAIDYASGGFAGHSIRQDAVDFGQELYDKEAFQKLGANKEMRQAILRLLAQGKYSDALEKIKDLDPEAAKRAVEEWKADKAEDDPFEKLDFDSFMNKGPTNEKLVAAQGVAVGLFQHLQNFIMGYTVASAAYDAVFMTVFTAGLGYLGSAAANGAKTAVAVGRAMQAARIAETTSTLARLARTLESLGKLGQVLLRATELAGKVVEFVGRSVEAFGKTRLVAAWATNFRNVLGVGGIGEKVVGLERAATYFRIAIPNAAKFVVKGAVTMGIASGGIQLGMHYYDPSDSQFKSGGDAFKQGFIGGAAFGAKAGPLLLMNPIQASAFGSGVVGNAVRGMAETPGPLSSMIKGGARLLPGAARGTVAELGPLGALQKAALTASPSMQTLAKAAVWGGAMFDGALKYMLASWVPQQMAQLGSYYFNRLMDSLGRDKGPNDTGATSAVTDLAASQRFSETIAHSAWLFVPVNTMYSAKDMETQASDSKAFSYLMRSGRGLEIENASKEQVIAYDKPWYQWSVSDGFKAFMAKLAGRSAAPQGKLTVSEQYRELAAKERMKTLTNGELLAIANAPREGEADLLGRTVRISKDGGTLKLLEAAAGGSPRETVSAQSAPGAKGAAEKASGSRLFSKPSRGDAVDVTDLVEVRITNESMAAAREVLVKRLRSDGALRLGILGADKSYKLKTKGSSETVTIEGRELQKLKEIAAMEQLETRAPVRGVLDAVLSFGRSLKDVMAGRMPENRYQKTVRQLKNGIEGATAGEIIASAQGQMDAMIASRKKWGLEADAKALEQARGTIESDAFLEWANERMVENFTAFTEGRLTEKGLDASIAFYREVWEKGVFGNRFGEPIKNEKGELEWPIPAEYQVHNQKGDLITSFRPIQAEVIKALFKDMAAGKKLNFGMLKTSGGKTLLSFVFLSFLDTHARMTGRKGAIYATTNGDLVAQATNDYLAFFKGRRPRFEIMTYSDLELRQAMADAMGTPSPYETNHVVNDEFDQLGTETALSLGSPNGRLSYARLDPLQEVLRLGVHEVWTKLYKKYGGSDINVESFYRMMRENPAFASEFSALCEKYGQLAAEAIAKVKPGVTDLGESLAFRRQLRDLESPLYKKLGITSREQFIKEFGTTPEQIYMTMRAEYDHAFGGYGGLKVGVVERQHGSVQKWVAKILEGAYHASSMKDLSKIYAVGIDPSRPQDLVQYHADKPLDNLDTSYRAALELRHSLPLTLDFDNLAVVDFRGLNMAAKRGGGFVVALSGTMPEQMRPFMESMGWSIRGKGSVGQAVEYSVLKPGVTSRDHVVEGIKQAADANMPFGEWSALPEGSRPGRKVAVLFAETKAEQEAYEKALDSAGITAERRSVAVTPDSNFLYQERLRPEVLEEKNLEALKSGEADVVILVGQSGLRGLDLPFGAYKGGEISMYITNPHTLSTANRKQLTGRIDSGRIPEGTRTTIHGIVEFEFLKAQSETPGYREIVIKRLEGVASGADVGLWKELMDLTADKLAKGRDADEQAVAELLKDPAAFKGQDEAKGQAVRLLGQVLEIRELRDLLADKGIETPQQIEAARKDPAAMGRIAADARVSEALIRELMIELQKDSERKSLESSGIFNADNPGFGQYLKNLFSGGAVKAPAAGARK